MMERVLLVTLSPCALGLLQVCQPIDSLNKISAAVWVLDVNGNR